MNQKVILVFFILFILISFSWLAYHEKQQEQIQNQWFLYFKNSSDNSLNFIIENFTKNEKFTWTIIKDNQVIQSKDETIKKQSKKEIDLDLKNKNGKIIIQVKHNSNENDKKEIYKFINRYEAWPQT